MGLAEYRAKIEAVYRHYLADPEAVETEFEAGEFEGEWEEVELGPRYCESCGELRELSVEIRRQLWNRRDLAYAVAAAADRLATDIAIRHDLASVSPLPRFPAYHSDSSGRANAIQ